MKLSSIIRKWGFPLLLTFIVGMLVGANYTPGTFLSGWDTLHPEFNLPLAFSRVFTGVWRTDQGLGAVAGHSHMADIPHLVILWMLSLVEPLQLIRYSFVFLCLLSGVFGMYYFLNHILKTNKFRSFLAFVSALVYLTNLGTVQQFIVPFEMFTVEYALLPWILLTATHYFETPTRKHMLLFIVTIILASPMAYAATLWYTFFGLFALSMLWISLQKQRKNGIKLLITTICLNLYWLLPNIYFVLFHGKNVELSKVNQLFSPEAFAKNQEFGNFANLPFLKNFLFDWQLFSAKTSAFINVMGPWQSHVNNPLVLVIGLLVFFLALLGVIRVFRQKNKQGQALALVFLISGFLLLNGTWPITVLFDALGNVSSVAKEALRLPFTKFSIFYALSMSALVGYGLEWMIVKWKQIHTLLLLILVSVFLLFSFLPAFEGYLIQPAMRISIPQEYFDMFSWFNKQNHDGRVAILPIHSFWNWTYYTWGYQGAGFLQFGIPQPILDRDYDRWSPDNQQYEQEMSYAIYSQNPENIRTVLSKYNVTWVLIDNSVFAPASNENQTLLWLIPKLMDEARLTQVKSFGKNITIYKTTTATPTVVGYTNTPSSAPLNPYFSLLNRDERITQQIPGTVVAQYVNRSYNSTDVPDTDHIDIPILDHKNDYELEITSKHTSGFPLELCVSNNLTSHCDLYVYLGTQSTFTTERFLLPKLEDYGTGYSLDFNNFTIHGMTSVNDIQSIRVFALAPQILHVTQPATPAMLQNVTKISPVFFKIRITHPSTTLALWQTYEPGWIAIKNNAIQKHIMLNTWANGWTGNFGTNDIIYIMYRPQVLEWIGFIL